MSSCVPDIKECGPYSRVSCGVYLDCKDFMESYCMCSPGYRSVSEAMFNIDLHKTCDGKKNPVSSFSSFIRFWDSQSFLQVGGYVPGHSPSLNPKALNSLTKCHLNNFGISSCYHLISYFHNTKKEVAFKMLQDLTECCIPVQYSSLSSSVTATLRPSLTRVLMDTATPGALSDPEGLEGPCSEM